MNKIEDTEDCADESFPTLFLMAMLEDQLAAFVDTEAE
jgi:hypothetical protein